MQKLNIQQLPVDDTKSSSDGLWSSAKNKLELDKRIQNELNEQALTESQVLSKLVANPNTRLNGFFYNSTVNQKCYYEGLYTSKIVSGEEIHYGFCQIKGMNDSTYRIDYRIDWEDSLDWHKTILKEVTIDDSTTSSISSWSSSKINEIIQAKNTELSDLITTKYNEALTTLNNKLILNYSGMQKVNLTSTGQSFTAPSRGVVYFSQYDNGGRVYRIFYVNGQNYGNIGCGQHYSTSCCVVNAGDTISVDGALGSLNYSMITFIPFY